MNSKKRESRRASVAIILTFLSSLGGASLNAFADLRPGTYTVFDRYGLKPSPDENSADTKKYTDFLSHTKKGGILRVHTLDPIDLINPDWFVKGLQVQMAPFNYPYVFESLMHSDIRGSERTYYPGIAKSVTSMTDGQTFEIDLRTDVRFSDGSLLTANDVASSWTVFTDEIMGEAKAFEWKPKMGDVKVTVVSPNKVQVQFGRIQKNGLREAIFYFLGLKIVKENKSSSPGISIPNRYIGTGPYFYQEANRKGAHLVRRKDYWNSTSPLYNFDDIYIESFRDATVVREAFMGHTLNFYVEERAQNEAVLDEKLNSSFYTKKILDQSAYNVPNALLYMNMTQEHTRDLRFRQAMTLLYDADQIFRTLYASSYTRQRDFMETSDFFPHGAPNQEIRSLFVGDPQEAALDQPYESTGIFALNEPASLRDRMRKALGLLREAGYVFTNQKLTKEGKPVELHFSYRNNAPEEKALVYFADTLSKLGIETRMHPAPDSATFIHDIDSNQFNFAMVHFNFPRKYDVLDIDDTRFRFGSESGVDVPKGNHSSLTNMKSPLLDRILTKMESADPASTEFHNLEEAALRVISFNVPHILLGERVSKSFYMEKGMCLPPVATEYLLEAAYFSASGSCP